MFVRRLGKERLKMFLRCTRSCFIAPTPTVTQRSESTPVLHLRVLEQEVNRFTWQITNIEK
jgi:hypothetical protein